jgi:hypothetical protein
MSDARWRRFYIQRRFLAPGLREWIADRIARRRRQRIDDPVSVDMVSDLRTVGQVNLGRRLTERQCAELRRYFAEREVVDLYRPERAPFLPLDDGRHPLCHVANHSDADIVAAPYLVELANDPQIVNVLHQYFGCLPLISYLGCWWSYPTEAGPQQAENFHRDVDDWRFIKLFVYLTDVEAESGPHVYVRGSAGSGQLRNIRRYQDEEVISTFGRQAISMQIAKAGSAFLENTFGLHKGTQVQAGRRLLFQAVYSLHPIPYGPATPVARFDDRLPAGDDAVRRINRVYLA